MPLNKETIVGYLMVWFGGFYGISTFVGYLMPNPFSQPHLQQKTGNIEEEVKLFHPYSQNTVWDPLI